MRVLKNNQSHNNMPDNDTITPAGVHMLQNIPAHSLSFYHAPNRGGLQRKTGEKLIVWNAYIMSR